MNVLCMRLLLFLSEEPYGSANFAIAQRILDHIDEIEKRSIQDLADLCGVSKSMISKFVRNLGFEDYKDFRMASPFQDNKYGNEINYVHNVLGYLSNHSYQDYVNTINLDLMKAVMAIDLFTIDRLVDDLACHKNVFAFGYMFSQRTAEDLQTKLGYVKKFIITSSLDLRQEELISQARPEDLIIIFSDSGQYMRHYYESNMIEFDYRSAIETTPAKVVLITNNKEAAKMDYVDYAITYPRSSNLITHRYIYQLVTDLIVDRYYHRVYLQNKK
ncbi:MAG: MurR/RpiR family transcriptional regulator [Allobaculum sp.]